MLAKIWYLCKEINSAEWSGILFYKPEGDSTDFKNFKMTAVDIFLMHKGTAASTEYSFDTDVMSAYDNNPDLMNCKIGHVH